jgi:hypothetical protein
MCGILGILLDGDFRGTLILNPMSILKSIYFFLSNVMNITGNFLNRILELFSAVDTVSAPSVIGILRSVYVTPREVNTNKIHSAKHYSTVELFQLGLT